MPVTAIQYKLSGNYGQATLLVPKYSGKYKNNPLTRLLSPDALATQFAQAFERILARLGLPADGIVVLVKFNDNGSEFASTTTLYNSDGEPIQLINFCINAFIKLYKFVTNIYEEVKHEAAHAVQRHWIGDNYESVPRWWREGSALYAAWPQGDVRVLAHYAVKAYNLNDLVTGLKPKKFSMIDYPESYLAIKLIIERFGLEKVKEINLLLGEDNFDDVFPSAINMTMDEFSDAVREYAQKEMQTYEFVRFINLQIRKMRS